jgi:hypothetical protein
MKFKGIVIINPKKGAIYFDILKNSIKTNNKTFCKKSPVKA